MKKKLIFDTSSINNLADDPAAKALQVAIKEFYTVRITGTTFSEVAATRDTDRRNYLFTFIRPFVFTGHCVESPKETIDRLARAYDANRSGFDVVTSRCSTHRARRRDR